MWNRLTQAIRLRRRAEAGEPRLEQAATDVLARVAHEARQPLSAARTAFQIVRYCPHDERRERACVVVERQFDRLARLFEDLIDTVRLRRSTSMLRLGHVDLRQLVNDAAESVALQAESKHQHLKLELPEYPVWLDADSARLQQVASNLLVNGVRYTEPGGHLFVTVTRTPQEAVLKVADTGRGIPQNLLTHLFEPFTRGEAGGEGLGVGLAIARQIVELHGGTIRAASAGPGTGSEFVVKLPLCASGHEQLIPKECAATGSRAGV